MIPIYVCHAPSLRDRFAHVERELGRAGLAFEWVVDFDPATITPDIDALYFAQGADLSAAQKSCALKHIVAMQRICVAGHDRALILEDDVQLVGDFSRRLSVLLKEAAAWPRPHVLHLGAATNFYTPADQLRAGQTIYVGNRVRNMEAYVLGAVEARARLDWIAAHPMREPIDLALNVADPALGIPFLWPEPPLAEQGSLNGLFASSLTRKKQSRLKLKLQFHIQKFRRRYVKRWLNLK